MNKIFAALLIILCFIAFSFFVYFQNRQSEVLDIISPVKFGIDLNNNKVIDNNEIICLAGVSETFTEDMLKKFTLKNPKFDISSSDDENLKFLAKDYATKNLLNKWVKLKIHNKYSSECINADIFIDKINYVNLLENNGFLITDTDFNNMNKIKTNILEGRNLNLVVYNHHSNKYHKLDCKFAKLAHDKVIIPLKHLDKEAKPCKYCHNIRKKFETKTIKKYSNGRNNNFDLVVNTDNGLIKFFHSDFSKHLKPDAKCLTNECKELVNLINNSISNIDIAIYGYDEVPSVNKSLEKAHKRGVKIRFVYDEPANNQQGIYKNNDYIKSLSEKFNSDKNSKLVQNIMHNKFMIFDKKIVYTGSMNFSKSGLSGYDQNDIIIINSKEVANLYELEFEQMLNGRFHKDKIKHNANNKFNLGGSVLEIYFSPQYNSATRVIELIQKSKKYIYAPIFLITHKEISDALISAKKRGVDVKIIMDANNTATRNSKHKLLRACGIALKVENYAGKLHSKTMIIDDEHIIMGSMNFSNSGANKNDENMIVIYNPIIAKSYKKFFLYLWDTIPNKYLNTYVRAESPDSIGSCNDEVDNNFNGKIDAEDESCIPHK